VSELELTGYPRKIIAWDKVSSRSNKLGQDELKDNDSTESVKPSSLKLNDNWLLFRNFSTLFYFLWRFREFSRRADWSIDVTSFIESLLFLSSKGRRARSEDQVSMVRSWNIRYRRKSSATSWIHIPNMLVKLDIS